MDIVRGSLKSKDELISFYRELSKKFTSDPPLADKEGKIIRFNERWVPFSSRYWPASLIEVVKGLGPVVKTFLYNFGYCCGRDATKRYLSMGISKENVFNYQLAGCWYLGWFLGYVDKILDDKAVVVLLNSFEAESILKHFGKQDEPSCHITRGVLAGNWSVVLGKDAVGVEVECMAKGDKCCTFILKPKAS